MGVRRFSASLSPIQHLMNAVPGEVQLRHGMWHINGGLEKRRETLKPMDPNVLLAIVWF